MLQATQKRRNEYDKAHDDTCAGSDKGGARRAIFRALSERVDFRRGQIDDRLYRRVHGFHGELHAHAHRDRSPSPCRHPQSAHAAKTTTAATTSTLKLRSLPA